MKAVETLSESPDLDERATERGLATISGATDATRHAAVTWSMALIPVVSLVIVGVVLLLLTRLALTPEFPTIESSRDETSVDLPTAVEVESDARVLRIAPVYTR